MKHCMLMSVLSLLFSPAAAGHGAARRRDLRGETLPEVSPAAPESAAAALFRF